MVKQGIPVPRDIVYCLLQGCITKQDLESGKQVHHHIIGNGLDSFAIFGDHLIRLFESCGSLPEANKVFGMVQNPSVYTYNAIMQADTKLGGGKRVLELYDRMQIDKIKPDKVTFLCILKACSMVGDIRQGRLMLDQIIYNGLEKDVVIANTIIDMYAKCGSLEEAFQLFEELPHQDVVSWAVMIGAFVEQGHDLSAIDLFAKMQQDGLKPNVVVYLFTLKACCRLGAVSQGRQIHEQIMRMALESDVLVSTTLVDMYAKLESLEEAQKVFDKLANQNVVSFNVLIAGYAQNGQFLSALTLFERMQQEGPNANRVTLITILKACSSIQTTDQGRLIHNQIIQSGLDCDVALGNSLVDMYVKWGSLEEAQRIFDKILNRDVVSWGSIIAGYALHGHGLLALEHFEGMERQGLKPNKVIFVCILKACGSIGALEQGRRIHECIASYRLEQNAILGSTIVDMYARCESLEESHKVFEELLNRDVVSWGALISGYVQHGHGQVALGVFEKMQQEGVKPNEVIFLCILQACTNMEALGQGRLIHHEIVGSGFQAIVAVGNSLIDMYAKCGSLEDAQRVFDDLPNKDLATWGSLIGGYTQHEHCLIALKVFQKMQQDHMIPNRAICLCILRACGSIGAIDKGQQIHKQIIELGLESDVAIGNALVDMYSKCGSHDETQKAFAKLVSKDVVSWGTMIAGHVWNGNSRLAVQCFEAMQHEELNPDHAIFTNILAACSHGGLLEKGHHYFMSMTNNYSVTPGIQHYNSMVDLLGRAGDLKAAEDLLQCMPMCPDIIAWTSLLTGCRTYGNIELAKRCFDVVVQLDPDDASGYVLMSHIYTDANMWDNVKKVQGLRNLVHAEKRPGRTWIELYNNVLEFTVGNKSYFHSEEIDIKVKFVGKVMKDYGFIPQVDLMFESMSNEEEVAQAC